MLTATSDGQIYAIFGPASATDVRSMDASECPASDNLRTVVQQGEGSRCGVISCPDLGSVPAFGFTVYFR